MATRSVSGKTEDELADMRAEFQTKNRSDHYDFEECFCLAKIPKQPEDYDGPVRYCSSTNLKKNGRCKYHGGATKPRPENLDKYGNMKHGMRATRKALLDTMDREGNEWQVDLYEWVSEEWPEAYGIDLDEDPNAEYEFHALALEIVRAERAEGWVFKEGEKGSKKIFGPDGSVHYEDVPHYLSDMLQRQRKLVMRMEDNLGISRKKRMQNEQAQDATDVMKSFAEVGAALISDTDREYDPGDWNPDDT